MKTINKVFAVIFFILCAGLFTACSNELTEPVQINRGMNLRSLSTEILSDMTEYEALNFITDNGIAIPDGFPGAGAFIKETILAVESDPNIPFAYNYNATLDFAESIKDLVNRYYGKSQRNSTATRLSHYLQDSLVFNGYINDWRSSSGGKDYWLADWVNYNCYAFAIDRTEQPSEYISGFQYQPGDFAHTGKWGYNSIDDLTPVVIDDLDFLGYSDFKIFSYYDPKVTPLEPHQKLICIRIGPDDIHFMKYNKEDEYWYHKPGGTAPLKYKYHPSDYVWTNERSFKGVEYPANTIYDSEINYVVYNIFAGGDGSKNDPYQIKTKQQLQYIPLVDDSGVYFELIDDIDLQGLNWTPLPVFEGILDGGYFYIENMHINGWLINSVSSGLFSENNGHIKNLFVSGEIFVGFAENVGMICGINSGLINHCSVSYAGYIYSNDMISYYKQTSASIGGIAGRNNAMIRNCINNGDIHGHENTGGITGLNSATGAVTDSYNTAYIWSSNANAGGIAGLNAFGRITRSWNTGETGGYINIGGIAGYNLYGTITNSYNTSDVFGSRDRLGKESRSKKKLSNRDYVSGSENVGGIVGYNESGTISESYNTGEIFCYGDYVGGIAGYNLYGQILNVYNIGDVSGNDNIGGITGCNKNGTVLNTYNTGEIYGHTCTGGIVAWYIGNPGTIANNVSLGRYISCVYGAARIACCTGYFYNNQARYDMYINCNSNPMPINNGDDVYYGTALSTVFGSWDLNVWSIPGSNLVSACDLPVLKNILTGTQNPELP